MNIMDEAAKERRRDVYETAVREGQQKLLDDYQERRWQRMHRDMMERNG